MLMLIVVMILVSMMPNTVKRRFVTANVTSWGPMGHWVESLDDKNILCIQEHHVAGDKIGEQESKMADLGWKGLWSPAVSTERGGTSGGLAILGPSYIHISSPPLLDGHTLWEGRVMAAHVHAAVPGGVVVINVYLDTELQFEGDNMAMIWRIVEYAHALNQRGFDWIIMGDFNMEMATLNANKWIESIKGVGKVAATPTCIKQIPGSIIDIMILGRNLVSKFSDDLSVDTQSGLWPHRPVSLGVEAKEREVWARVLSEPRPLPKQIPIGCAHAPWCWDKVAPLNR